MITKGKDLPGDGAIKMLKVVSVSVWPAGLPGVR
jgi:hypothetical protein